MKFENAEEIGEEAGYCFRVDEIDTRAEIVFDETGQNARNCWLTRCRVDEGRAALLDDDHWCNANQDATVRLSVEDNGMHGDGMWITATLCQTGNTFEDPDGGELFSISLAPRQARIFAEAIMSAVRMRYTSDGE